MDAAPTPAAPPIPAAARGVPAPLAPRSAAVALILGWVLPGLAQCYVGRYLKGLLMLVTIGGLFVAGLAMTGFTCVNPYTYELEFVAHALIGGPTAAAYWLSRGIVLEDPMPYFEAGRLYAAVAGLLNVVAICDALGDVLDHNARARDRARERRAFYAERAAHEEAVAAARIADEDVLAGALHPPLAPPAGAGANGPPVHPAEDPPS